MLIMNIAMAAKNIVEESTHEIGRIAAILECARNTGEVLLLQGSELITVPPGGSGSRPINTIDESDSAHCVSGYFNLPKNAVSISSALSVVRQELAERSAGFVLGAAADPDCQIKCCTVIEKLDAEISDLYFKNSRKKMHEQNRRLFVDVAIGVATLKNLDCPRCASSPSSDTNGTCDGSYQSLIDLIRSSESYKKLPRFNNGVANHAVLQRIEKWIREEPLESFQPFESIDPVTRRALLKRFPIVDATLDSIELRKHLGALNIGSYSKFGDEVYESERVCHGPLACSGVNWPESTLHQMDIRGSDFSRSKLPLLTLKNIDLAHSNFAGSDLSGARLKGSLQNSDIIVR